MSAGRVPPAHIWGIVPAAGVSRRMGRPKQWLPFRSSTVAGAVVGTLLEAGLDGVVVVTRAALLERMRLPHDARLHVAWNEDAASEMIDSIRIGLETLSGLDAGGGPVRPTDGVLVVPGDLPLLSQPTCRRCMDVYRADSSRIIVAAYRTRRGHPILFPYAMHRAIGMLKDGLRDLLRQCADRVVCVDVDDPGVVCDVNTLDDYTGVQKGGT